MTQLMGRPILGLPSELGTRSAFADLLMGARTALLTLAVVAVPVLGLWVLVPYSDDTAADAARLAFGLWLLGHGAPLARGGEAGPVTVTPLLLTAVTVLVLHRAGLRVGRRGRRGWRAPLAVAAGYLAVAAVAVAQCTAAEAVLRARPLPDLAMVAAVLAAGFGPGLWAGAGRPLPPAPAGAAQWPARWLPQWLPRWRPPAGAPAAALRAAGLWSLGLLAGAGLLLTLAVLLGGAGHSAHTLGGGTAGFLGLLLACALLMPNALLWAACYALGTGFAVGTGTLVAPTGTSLGALPEFPLLAVVPQPGGAPGWLLVCVLPALAGVLPALLLGRAAAGERPGAGGSRWSAGATASTVLAAALLAGAPAVLAGWAAGGALAGGRMSELGPAPWRTGAVVALWLAGAVLPGALLTRWCCLRGTAPGWWQWLSRLTVRYTARPRAGLHRVLTRLAELRLPFSRRA
ncbi:DUF6350 family protein [Kitasatospora sp. NPDC049258]|uniref:cell division protein PerM n=1 Tax=Kitasatospora sp. NPDC049258 TaxID=3155394 RepID=UPI0034426B92